MRSSLTFGIFLIRLRNVAVSHTAKQEMNVYKAFSISWVLFCRFGQVILRPFEREMASVLSGFIDANANVIRRIIQIINGCAQKSKQNEQVTKTWISLNPRSRLFNLFLMSIKATTFLFCLTLVLSMNLRFQHLEESQGLSSDVEVVHTSTKQVLKLPNSQEVQLLTVPDGYQFYSYSSGQCCLESVFNYYQFPTSPRPYKEDFFFNDADFDNNNFTTPEKLVQQAQLTLSKQASDEQKNAFQIRIQESLSNRDLESFVDSQNPIILLITRGSSVGYVIVIGYDQENYYFEDPYTIRSISYLPKNALQDQWKAYIQSENRWTNRLGIVISFKNERKREIVPTVRPLP